MKKFLIQVAVVVALPAIILTAAAILSHLMK
jgi:hypothetical protein